MENHTSSTKEKLAGVLLVAGVGLCSAIGGFSWTLAGVQRLEGKNEANDLGKQIPKISKAAQLHAEGVQLATKALAWGSLYAVLGVSSFTFGVWILSGAKNEFREKMGSILPKLTRKAEGKTEDFNDLEEVLQLFSSKK